MQKPMTGEEWNIVKRKKSSERTSSPQKEASISPKKKSNEASEQQHSNSNSFLSLSNLDGGSNVSNEEILSTTATVLGHMKDVSNHHNSGMSSNQQGSLSSIHQLDKSILAKVSSSSKHKPTSTGVVIKDKPNQKNRSS